MKQTDQLVWIIYDIVEDKARTRIAKLTLAAGLYRVQKSVFLGTIQRNQLDELELEIEELINPKKDSVYIFPICEQDFKKVRLIGKVFDKAMIRDEVKSLFL
ncbi:CRISPR-associated endonuclease Cas2 [candidate division KSB1 bacterium]|nr:CRISPR-associated endonuclease Cas2 [candidate division KSB1 bacterium]